MKRIAATILTCLVLFTYVPVITDTYADSVCLGDDGAVAVDANRSAAAHSYGDDNLCDVCGEDAYAGMYNYVVQDGIAILTGVNDTVSDPFDGTVVLPETLGGAPLSIIGSGALRKNETFFIAANKTNGLLTAGDYTADENGVLTPV